MSNLRNRISYLFPRIKMNLSTILYSFAAFILVCLLSLILFNKYYFSTDDITEDAFKTSQRVVINLENGDIVTLQDIEGIKKGKKPVKKPEAAAEPIKIETPVPKLAQISVIIVNLGHDKPLTAEAIALPPEFVLSFSPYGSETTLLSKAAAEKGHEIAIDLPLESKDDEFNKQALTIKTGNNEFRNAQNLQAVISKVFKPYYLITAPDETFSQSEGFTPLMKEITKKGLLMIYTSSKNATYIETKTREAGLETLIPDTFISGTADELLNKLADIQNKAAKSGFATIVIKPSADSIEAIKKWHAGLDPKSVKVVPLMQ